MFRSSVSRLVRWVAAASASVILAVGCASAPEGASEGSEVEASPREVALERKREAPPKECTVPDKTAVASKGKEYVEAARMLQPTCNWEPCHCSIDGLETSCWLVANCLRVGFCVLARG